MLKSTKPAVPSPVIATVLILALLAAAFATAGLALAGVLALANLGYEEASASLAYILVWVGALFVAGKVMKRRLRKR